MSAGQKDKAVTVMVVENINKIMTTQTERQILIFYLNKYLFCIFHIYFQKLTLKYEKLEDSIIRKENFQL
jgi:hypothetical protein